MSSHTKAQLIKLAPEEMLYKHIDSLKLPDFIKQELTEQMIFFGSTKKEKMCHWCKEQFIEWYYASE